MIKQVSLAGLILIYLFTSAPSLAAPCKRVCRSAISRCAAAGYRRVQCRRTLIRECKLSGQSICDLAFLPTTTTSLPSGTKTTTLPSTACGGNVLVYSSDLVTYLGCWTCSSFDTDSIFNQFGTYGSEFSQTSIWNEFSPYGSPYASTSACNGVATSPPVLADEHDCFVARLSVNKFVADSVCGVLGDVGVCNTLIAICGSP